MVDSTQRTQEGNRPKPDETPKNDPQKSKPSAFDDVLRQNRATQPMTLQQATIANPREAGGERHGASGGRDQQDKKEGGSKEERVVAGREERKSTASQERSVEAKSGSQDQKEEGRRGQGQGSTGGGGGRGAAFRDLTTARVKDSKTQTHGQMAAAFSTQLKKMAQANLSREHIQQIVNKVLQFFRIKKKADGTTELHIGFNEEIFKGLRLRLVQKDGKVSLHIQAGEARKLFESKREDLVKALEKKGVKVSEIVIS